jgi:hypothetical protein
VKEGQEIHLAFCGWNSIEVDDGECWEVIILAVLGELRSSE